MLPENPNSNLDISNTIHISVRLSRFLISGVWPRIYFIIIQYYWEIMKILYIALISSNFLMCLSLSSYKLIYNVPYAYSWSNSDFASHAMNQGRSKYKLSENTKDKATLTSIWICRVFKGITDRRADWYEPKLLWIVIEYKKAWFKCRKKKKSFRTG